MADKINMFKIANNKVNYTDNYNMFRELDGNRAVLRGRIEKLKNSIQKHGYIGNPIVANEKNEIIDGQGRFNALKELGMPIPYITVIGIGVKECRAMNVNMKNWTTPDYILSYANEIVDYKYLQILNKNFKFGVETIVTAVRMDPYSGANAFDVVRNGDFKCSEEEYQNALEVLSWLEGFSPYVEKMGGRKRDLYKCLIMCHKFPEVDSEKLLSQFMKYYNLASAVANTKQALEAIETIYNYRSRGEKVYIQMLYDKYVHGGK